MTVAERFRTVVTAWERLWERGCALVVTGDSLPAQIHFVLARIQSDAAVRRLEERPAAGVQLWKKFTLTGQELPAWACDIESSCVRVALMRTAAMSRATFWRLNSNQRRDEVPCVRNSL